MGEYEWAEPAFWTFARPRMQKLLDGENGLASAEEIHDRINRVDSGPVRIDANEVTYNLHIILRFEIECELLDDKIDIGDLPSLWSRRIGEYLGAIDETIPRVSCKTSIGLTDASATFPLICLVICMLHIFAAVRAALSDIEAQIARLLRAAPPLAPREHSLLRPSLSLHRADGPGNW